MATTVALLLAAPSAAQADESMDVEVESYVLPLGSTAPSLEELQSQHGMELLRDMAQDAESIAELPNETVGPAAAYAPLARQPSRSTPVDPPTGKPAPMVALPEPAHTMTLDECKKGLGSTNKFYFSSRFAACSGASFVQTWLVNGRPAGVSMFNVRVVGTIPKNSRTIKFTYYFTEMESQGTTEAAAMKIGTKGKIPQSWPSKARYTRGGNMPGTKTFAELKVLRTFNETVNAKPGRGSRGTTDLIAAVYQPSITITPPPNATLTGDLKGDLFILPSRWDAAGYLANSTGGGNPVKKGAASFAYIGTLVYSTKAGAEERAVAQHIKTAFTKPEDTKPYMSAKKVPGQTAKEPLHRTVNKTRRTDNRKAAVKQCKRYWGANYTHGGVRECDEYPFATTYEGAAEHDHDADAKKFNFSVKPIAKEDNGAAGNLLRSFYAKNRIIDGTDDGFIVKIVS
ncbi:hypothetical protein ACFZCL_00055 [Streptomyces sp. NPDC008159]|uniref:NucA/NucB deoxyribonuclease domain-containing protein n=1 Tax=Streptomyces sp. NPDC008159 TaxID=3364817 RepID=UPI0036EDD4B3